MKSLVCVVVVVVGLAVSGLAQPQTNTFVGSWKTDERPNAAFQLDGKDLVVEVYSVPEKQNERGLPRAVFTSNRLQREQ